VINDNFEAFSKMGRVFSSISEAPDKQWIRFSGVLKI
jgi:hypothetical protein